MQGTHFILRSLFIVCFLCTVCCNTGRATDITYTKADSLKVVGLLEEGSKLAKGTNLICYYGNRLKGVPYVAHTLEVNRTEKLVVNLRQLDCTTFVETVFALALTTQNGQKEWKDYCHWLETIRYRDGKADGYASRNHYFLWWAENNEAKKLVTLPLQELAGTGNSDKTVYPYACKQVIKIDYMSVHPSYYSMLKDDKDAIAEITRLEQRSNGKVMMYIPASYMNLNQKQMKYVQNGDILAIVTKKKGLDTTHIGIAEWGKDGKLHLLNASQIHKKVILEPKTMYQYMSGHPSQLGVWVIRPQL